MNKLKSLIISLILISSLNLVFSQNIVFLNHFQDENSKTDKLSYELSNLEELRTGDEFKLEIYKNEVLIDQSCNKNIELDENSFYIKLICESDKISQGNYVLVGQIIRNNEILDKKITKIQNSELGKSVLNYKIENGVTKIKIDIDSNQENLQIVNEIPKEVFEYIDENNKNEIIESKKEFIIIENDPIIAWNIDKAPETIEYTIKSESKQKDLNNIHVEIKKQNSYKYLTYIVYILIIIILAIIIKPIFKKNKNNSKNKSKN